LPEDVVADVVGAIVEMAGVGSEATVLEIGTGTGQIGARLFQHGPRYVGVDESALMLERFLDRFSPGEENPELFEADGNRRWPVGDGSAHVIFGSRTLHLLECDHVVNEVARVASQDGAVLMIGSVRRDEHSVADEMRRQMRKLLRDKGIAGRSRERSGQALFSACCERGCRRLEPRVAARWTIAHSPAASLESWRRIEGLAGTFVSEATKKDVLDQLEEWAVSRFGDLRQSLEMQQWYLLEGVRIPVRQGA
jgi:SAM-dependent methyltransferase